MIGRAFRSNGVVFIVSVLAMIALLVVGLGIASWFTAAQAMHDGDANFAHATTSIGLAKIEVCAYERCVSAFTLQLDDSSFGKIGLATLLVGAGFGALVLFFAKTRIADGEITRRLKFLGYALGVATLVLALATMLAFQPEAMGYEIVSYSTPNRFSRLDDVDNHAYGVTEEPSLGSGGILTMLGTLLGGLLVWGTRVPMPLEEEARPSSPRVRVPKTQSMPRGPETDPFRAPPAPVPLAVVRRERATSAPPVVENPSDDGPKLLR